MRTACSCLPTASVAASFTCAASRAASASAAPPATCGRVPTASSGTPSPPCASEPSIASVLLARANALLNASREISRAGRVTPGAKSGAHAPSHATSKAWCRTSLSEFSADSRDGECNGKARISAAASTRRFDSVGELGVSVCGFASQVDDGPARSISKTCSCTTGFTKMDAASCRVCKATLGSSRAPSAKTSRRLSAASAADSTELVAQRQTVSTWSGALKASAASGRASQMFHRKPS
mmetsp:Transcript_22793/g.69743  ORF Transcript_22793/g.69743 Transcript_22793/m.69743 type:complete len:239 (-) Transcript_22793:510-1226(-)